MKNVNITIKSTDACNIISFNGINIKGGKIKVCIYGNGVKFSLKVYINDVLVKYLKLDSNILYLSEIECIKHLEVINLTNITRPIQIKMSNIKYLTLHNIVNASLESSSVTRLSTFGYMETLDISGYVRTIYVSSVKYMYIYSDAIIYNVYGNYIFSFECGASYVRKRKFNIYANIIELPLIGSGNIVSYYSLKKVIQNGKWKNLKINDSIYHYTLPYTL